MRRRFSSLAALFALSGMLFLQAAIALAACERPVMGLAAMQAAEASDCHEAGAPEALCLAHCQSEDQTIGKLPASLPDLAQAPVTASEIRLPRHVEPPPPLLFHPPAPPRRILFQSFQL